MQEETVPDSPPGGIGMTDERMSAAEAAASLQITRGTLYKLVHEGRIPAHRTAGRWFFLSREIEALFAGATGKRPRPDPAGEDRGS